MQEKFLQTARGLARAGGKKPRQSDLRRAVSTAYYALFTVLAGICADALVGRTSTMRKSESWARVFRALAHGGAKGQLKALSANPPPYAPRSAIDNFIALQEKRHEADYDPLKRLTRSDALLAIAEAEHAIRDMRSLSGDLQLELAVYLLFKSR
jgi:uncharacterized protein (UPF0332 family)